MSKLLRESESPVVDDSLVDETDAEGLFAQVDFAKIGMAKNGPNEKNLQTVHINCYHLISGSFISPVCEGKTFVKYYPNLGLHLKFDT